MLHCIFATFVMNLNHVTLNQQYPREIIMQVKECRKPIGTDLLNTFKITQYNVLDTTNIFVT